MDTGLHWKWIAHPKRGLTLSAFFKGLTPLGKGSNCIVADNHPFVQANTTPTPSFPGANRPQHGNPGGLRSLIRH